MEELIWMLRTGAGILPEVDYEYRETKICKWKNNVPTSTEKIKQLYVLKASEEDFVKFINELISVGRLEIRN